MTYTVREIYFTLQGEGARTGRPAVFLRFAGCNLWSGREADRAGAVCNFCDTEFVGIGGPGGGKFADATALAKAVLSCWPESAVNATPKTIVTPRPLIRFFRSPFSKAACAQVTVQPDRSRIKVLIKGISKAGKGSTSAGGQTPVSGYSEASKKAQKNARRTSPRKR